MIECKDLNEVRENIDRIDRDIVKLISERSRFVSQAAGFKKTKEDVEAPKRVEVVIARVRNLAEFEGVDPDIVENVYRTMISCFINFELKKVRK